MDADYLDQLVRRGLISPDAQENMLARTMTHQAEQPNPAAPYLAPVLNYARGGVPAVMRGMGYQPPGWMDAVVNTANNPELNTAMGLAGGLGMARGKSPLGITRPAFWDNPAKAAEVDALIAEGHSVNTIAEKAGLSNGSINRYLDRTGQKTAAAENPSFWTPEKEAGLIADYNKGMSQIELGKKYERSPGTIHWKLTSLGDAGKVDYIKRPPTFRENPDKQDLLKQRLAEERSHREIARDPNLGASGSSTISKQVRILQELGMVPKDYAPQSGFGLKPAGRTPTLVQTKSQTRPLTPEDLEAGQDMAKTLAKYLKFGT